MFLISNTVIQCIAVRLPFSASDRREIIFKLKLTRTFMTFSHLRNLKGIFKLDKTNGFDLYHDVCCL